MLPRTILPLALTVVIGCSPTRQVTYDLSDIAPVAPSSYARKTTLRVEAFEDARKTIPENGILFVRRRETRIGDSTFCINAEEHYKDRDVPGQLATIMAEHLAKRGFFTSVAAGPSGTEAYVLRGTLRRLFGKQEFSSEARTGSYFGLLGALATAGATTNGTIAIEFTDLTIRRSRDGKEMRLDNVAESLTGELHADAYCWCIYDNVHEHLRTAVGKLAYTVENAVAEMESQP